MSLLSQAALAIGFGQPILVSRYGQPLKIEVALHEDGPVDDYVFAVANSSACRAMGLDKNPALDLAEIRKTFRDGKAILSVETKVPYEDLWLSLVLEVHLPNGVLRRHFDLLVDMPEANDSPLKTTAEDSANTRADAPTGNPTRIGKDSPLPPIDGQIGFAAPLAQLINMVGESGSPNRRVDPITAKQLTGTFDTRAGGIPARIQRLATAKPPRPQPEFDARLMKIWDDIKESEARLSALKTTFNDVTALLDTLEKARHEQEIRLATLQRQIREKEEILSATPTRREAAVSSVAGAALLGGFFLGIFAVIFIQRILHLQFIDRIAWWIRSLPEAVRSFTKRSPGNGVLAAP
jgi:hypothetical protein